MSTHASPRQRLSAAAGMCGSGTAGVLITVLLAAGVSDAPPDDDRVLCEPSASGYVCDGPIDADDAFTRCRVSHPIPILPGKNIYTPSQSSCWEVDLSGDPNFGPGLPPRHID